MTLTTNLIQTDLTRLRKEQALHEATLLIITQTIASHEAALVKLGEDE